MVVLTFILFGTGLAIIESACWIVCGTSTAKSLINAVRIRRSYAID